MRRFEEKARKLSDLERILSKIYGYCVKASVRLVNEDMVWNQRLTEFKKVLSQLEDTLVRIKFKFLTFSNLYPNNLLNIFSLYS